MFGSRSSNLAELHTALVQNSFEKQLEESISAGLEAGLTQLPVCGDELCHHGAGLLETLHPGRAWVPVLEDNTHEYQVEANSLSHISRTHIAAFQLAF